MMSGISTPRVKVTSQQTCAIIDHLVDALAYHSSCTIRRATVLVDIHANPQTTQAEILKRLDVSKSALNRDIDWMFNYGALRRQECPKDARKIILAVSEYSAEHLEKALIIFKNSHKSLQKFLERFISLLRDEKSTLREAKIIAKIHESGMISKQEVLDSLYNGSATTENRALTKLIEEGFIKDVNT